MPALSIQSIRSTPKTSIAEDTDSNSREIAWSPVFFDFKMSLFKLKSLGFLNKKIHTLQILKNSGRQV